MIKTLLKKKSHFNFYIYINTGKYLIIIYYLIEVQDSILYIRIYYNNTMLSNERLCE